MKLPPALQLMLFLGCAESPTPPHTVGFRMLDLSDPARAFATDTGEIARPLHALMWYPAQEGTGGTMKYQDYVVYPGAGSPGSPAAVQRLAQGLETELGSPVDEAAFKAVLERLTAARRNASPASGRFPVLLLESGLNAPAFLYVDLAERLAGRGIRVITLPSFGHSMSRPLVFDTAGFATQRDDLRHAMRALDSLIDGAEVVVGGWSVGGLSTALAASDSSVRGVISLDGALGYEYGVGFSQALGLKPECLAVPFIHLTGTRPGPFRVPKSRTFFEGLPGGNAWWVTVPGLSHGDFTFYYGTRSPWFSTREDSAAVLDGMRGLEETVSGFIQHRITGAAPVWDSLAARGAIEQLPEDPEIIRSCSS